MKLIFALLLLLCGAAGAQKQYKDIPPATKARIYAEMKARRVCLTDANEVRQYIEDEYNSCGKVAVMARQQVEKEAQAISDSCAKALEKDLVSIFGKTYIVDLEHFADTQTILCPICRKDWYKGSNTLILEHNGKIIDRIKGVKLFPPQQIFQWYSLPSHRGDGPVTHEHGKHSCVLYFDGIAIKELSRQQVKVAITEEVERKILALQSRLDSLEAKLARVHIVAVRDSEYVKVETFLTGAISADTVYLWPKWQWVKRVRYIISFQPEVKK